MKTKNNKICMKQYKKYLLESVLKRFYTINNIINILIRYIYHDISYFLYI